MNEFIERRAHGRLRCEGVRCVLGVVHDLSRAGMRVRGRGRCVVKQDAHVGLTLTHAETNLPLQARVVWVRNRVFRGYQAGLLFTDVSGEAAEGLAVMARSAAPALSVSWNDHGPKDEEEV